MRPHHLTLAAFGPFAGEVEIDFDAMAASGLFLLQGDTGAGKTSILDGLAFALYGRVPGQRSGVGRLRSDHAAADLRTRVELDVSIGRRRLRITRWPEQERPKQRGGGTTRDPAKVLLQEAVDGGWRTVSTRVGEADAELLGLLGMSADQFHQVVLLPQGEFARFLRSDAGERARLLQRLFSTDRFRRVEDWLAERRRACTAELDAGIATVLRVAARVAQAAGVEEPPTTEDGVPARSWARELTDQADRAAADDAAAAARSRDLRTAADGELAAARELARRQNRRRELLEQQAAVERSRPLVADLSERLEAARRAAAVRSDLEQLARRRVAAEQLRNDVRRAREALVRTGVELGAGRGGSSDGGVASADIDVLRAEGRRRREALGRLAEAQRVEDDLAAERVAAGRARTAADAAATRAEQVSADLARLPAQRETLRADLDAAAAAALRLPRLEGEEQRLLVAVRDARAHGEATAQQRQRREQWLLAREREADLKVEAARLRNERVDSMIAELSAALVDDDPCPVCGATEHPDPSEVRGSRVTREQEEAARHVADEAATVAADLKAGLARIEAEIEGLVARLADAGVDVAVDPVALATGLAAELETLRCDLVATRTAAQVADRLRSELDRLDRDERGLAAALAEAEQTIEVERRGAAGATARAGQLELRLEELLHGAADVATAQRREAAAVQALDAVTELLARQVVADQEQADAETSSAAAVFRAGFTSAADAEQALQPAAVLTQLEAQLEDARATEAAVLAALAEPDVAVDLGEAAPVAELTTALRAADAESRAASASETRSVGRAAELARLVPVFEQQVEALEPLRRRAGEVRALADLAAGQGANRLRMTLSAYVLAARLEEVAAVASGRLRRMTQGRYTLVHTDAGRGNGRSGLGLLARDAWTGQDRDTATLSGGETFLASLALALALGDVVTAESGGTAIDALFVDEGFGSLDEDTLEEVMDTLDALREGGRMVGLVSHVQELRLRIPAQVHVRKGRNGSTVTVQTG